MLNTAIAAVSAVNIFSRLWDDQSVYWYSTEDHLNFGIVLLCLCAALVLGFLVSVLYMFTNRKRGYAQSYVLTMPVLALMGAAIVMTMCLMIDGTSSTKAAITLTAAFSLTRFRSAPADPKDLAYILSAIVIGIMCGTGYIAYGVLVYLILAVAMLAFYFTNFAAPKTQDMTLKITIPENLNYNGLFDNVMARYTTDWKLRRVKTTDFGTLFDLVYDVQVRDDVDQKKFIDEIRTLNGNLNVTLVLYRYDDQIYNTKNK